MEQRELTLAPESVGLRLDRWLAEQCPDLSRSQLQNLIEAGSVTCNGSPLNKKDKLKAGQTILLTLPDPQPIEAQPQNIPLDIVYEDDSLLVVNKPKGMVVHPAPGNPDGTMVNALLWHCAGRLSGIGGAIRPGIVHRIDKDTSAVTQQNSKYAYTGWQVLERFGNFTYIACKLKTGRTHQIRVHMASIGHPLAGDAVYGPKNCIRSLNGQCLHAKELGFVHPATGEWMQFDSSLPDWFQDYLSRLRKESRHGAFE